MRANQAHHRVATMCRVLGVSPSGYYAWRSRGRSNRAKRDEELRGTIRTIHDASGGAYGAPRVHAEPGGPGMPSESQTGSSPDARGGLGRGELTPRHGHYACGPEPSCGAGPGRTPVPGRCAGPPLGGGMVDGPSSSHRTGARGAEHGVGTTPPEGVVHHSDSEYVRAGYLRWSDPYREQRLRTCAAWRPDTVGYRDPVRGRHQALAEVPRPQGPGPE